MISCSEDESPIKRPISPIIISSESEVDEPPPRICVEENEFESFIRDPAEYKVMFGKVMTNMKATKQPVKEPFKVFFPKKREHLLQKIADDRCHKKTRTHVAKRLQALVDNHLRVNKLNKGNMEPLLPEEEVDFDVEKMLEGGVEVDRDWIPPISDSGDTQQTPYDIDFVQDFKRPGQDFSEKQQTIIRQIQSA